MTIHDIINGILEREGDKYTNDPKDSGGPTKYGITGKTAIANGYLGDMQQLTRSKAFDIYASVYYAKPNLAVVKAYSETLAANIMDFGVLAGPQTAIKMLQRSLNSLNRNGRDYAEITVDGILGKGTSEALGAFIGRRSNVGLQVLQNLVNALQAVYVVELAERRPKDEEYLFGWLKERAFGV